MASIRRNGKRWRAEVHANGQRASKSFATKNEAMLWSVEAERKMNLGTFSDRIVRDIFERYAEEVSPSKDGAKWEQNRLLYYSRDKFALVRLDELNATHTSDLRNRRLWGEPAKGDQEAIRPISGGTWRRDVALLSNCIKVAVKEWKWLPANPFSDTSLPEDNDARDRRVSESELAALRQVASQDINTIQHRTLLAFEFAIETAMRGGEICAMQRSNVHAKYVHIPAVLPGERKSKKRDVALSPRAREILAQIMALKIEPLWGLTLSQKDANFRKLVAMAAIEDLNFHDSRHEGITRLAKKMHVLALARMVGHSDINQLNRYYNESAADVSALLD